MEKRELRTFEDFRTARLGDAGFIVITDSTRPAIVHKLNDRCISADNFKIKVVLDGGSGGKYYWVDSISTAIAELGAKPCKTCKPHLPEKGVKRN